LPLTTVASPPDVRVTGAKAPKLPQVPAVSDAEARSTMPELVSRPAPASEPFVSTSGTKSAL
jgi:hypothetical protein